MARGPQWPQPSRGRWSGAGALLTVSLGHLGLAVPVDEDGRWAVPIWPAATRGLRQLPEPPGAPSLALSPGCAEASRDKASAGWCGGLRAHRIFLRVLSVQRFRMRSLLGRGGTAG